MANSEDTQKVAGAAQGAQVALDSEQDTQKVAGAAQGEEKPASVEPANAKATSVAQGEKKPASAKPAGVEPTGAKATSVAQDEKKTASVKPAGAKATGVKPASAKQSKKKKAAKKVFTISDLKFAYGDKVIFDGLNLSLTEGKVTTLIGANGSGKSTLFNLMTKNLKPQGGSILLRGGDVQALRLKDFAKLVSIVHQRNTAPMDLAVEKLVEYGRFPYHSMGRSASTDEDERMVAWALATTGLSEFARKPVSALSGGQAQRVWLAMALAQGAGVLLLDEPTTYLDVRYQLDILRLVRSLNTELGMTIVMVLHDINQALYYSDEIVALSKGRIVAQGAPSDVVTPELVRDVYSVDLDVISVRDKPFVLAV